MILLWVLLVLVVGLEKVGGIPVFHFLFSVQHSTWLEPVTFIEHVLEGMGVLLAAYGIGIACIKKKDIFYF